MNQSHQPIRLEHGRIRGVVAREQPARGGRSQHQTRSDPGCHSSLNSVFGEHRFDVPMAVKHTLDFQTIPIIDVENQMATAKLVA